MQCFNPCKNENGDFADEMISKITQDLVTYTLSDKQFAKVRIELGNAIEQAVSAK